MQTIPPFMPAVHLIGHAGIVATYKSVEATLDALGMPWIEANLGDTFGEACYFVHGYPVVRASHFILRTELGEPVAFASIVAIHRTRTRNRFPMRSWHYQLARWNGVGPVPRTGRNRGGYAYRQIGYASALRQAFCVEEEGEVAPRPARNFKNLPNGWDGRPAAARYDRCWKRFRRTQYKA